MKTQDLVVRLTDGQETFMLGRILCDEFGPAYGIDSTGVGYTRVEPHVWESDADGSEYEESK
jgi:hypothetical protein